MMIDEFEMGNSTSSQEREMDEGRNLIEEFKTPSPERVLNGNENTNTEEEITDSRSYTTTMNNGRTPIWKLTTGHESQQKTRSIQIIKHLW